MKFAACIEYDGTAYCGWQRLSHAPSVQEEVEKALSQVANEPISIVCAGRTDSGVHGMGQVIHFKTDVERSVKGWMLGTNTNLPDDISVIWIQMVNDDFHARFSALERRYRYIILNRKARSALHNKYVAWFYRPLDELAMHEAAQALLGEKDFSSFRAAACQARHAMREIKEIKVSREGDYIYVDLVANAFLHHMVRNIVGSLVEVGEGRWSVEKFEAVVDLKDRTKAGVTAPASGLYFVSVAYPEQFGIPQGIRLPVYCPVPK